MYGYRGKIGILVPSINTTMEMDFHRMVPEGISVHTARISWEAPESSVDALREMTDKAIEAAKDVAAAHVDVVIYGCTSGSFFKGITWDKELSEIIAREVKVPAITTSSAMVEGLREMGIKKVSVATPYSEEVDKKLIAFLEGNGFQVMRLESLRQKDVWEHARNAPFLLYQLGKKAFVPESDGVFISCTQLRAAEIAEQLEKDIGKPVVTAVQASLWLALKTLGFKSPVSGYGMLLTRL
ncbi:MAG: maleate cis-trans isomerase [Thermodesulfobacteriota bacterium]|nr:maleate cis-trans isomerase [Thermodesulfobacteriota bacterium]